LGNIKGTCASWPFSGSLRARSTNTTLLRALAKLTPPEFEVLLYQQLDKIPPFNADREAENDARAVAQFRKNLCESLIVLFSTPEYVHGIPRTLKNALDWVVKSGELFQKPVVIVNASSRAIHAQQSLKEILTTMGACLLDHAEVTVNLLGRDLTPAEIMEVPEVVCALNLCFRAISDHLGGEAKARSCQNT
jgi:chromate reductase